MNLIQNKFIVVVKLLKLKNVIAMKLVCIVHQEVPIHVNTAWIIIIYKQIHQNVNQLAKYIDGEMNQIERVNDAMMNAIVVKMIVLEVVIHVMETRF